MKYKKVVQLPYGVTDRFCKDMGITKKQWYHYRDLSYIPDDWDTPETIRQAAQHPDYGGKIAKVPVSRFDDQLSKKV